MKGRQKERGKRAESQDEEQKAEDIATGEDLKRDRLKYEIHF